MPNIQIFGYFCQTLLKMRQEDAPEDALMCNANIDVYSERNLEFWEQCHFNLDFPKLDHEGYSPRT